MNPYFFKEVSTPLKSMGEKIPDFSRGKNQSETLSTFKNSDFPAQKGADGKAFFDDKSEPTFLDNKQAAFKEQTTESQHLPVNNGEWRGDRGNSDWIPDDNFVPKKNNSDELTWAQIKEKYNFDSINFKEGDPDFSEVAQESVEIEDFTEARNGNFAQADESCAKKWSDEQKDGKSWTPDEVRQYRKENELTWHERSDMKTMDLVPSVIHNNIPHSGGISAIKGVA